jgi:hypothetical protein
MAFSQGLSRGRYLRLMAVAFCEILGTIPLGTYIIVLNTSGVTSYGSWASVHGHYSEVNQVPSVVWKNNSSSYNGLEMFRWSLVAAAFVFFALFGFADEARQRYRLVYTSLARRIGYSTSTLCESSHVSVVHSIQTHWVSLFLAVRRWSLKRRTRVASLSLWRERLETSPDPSRATHSPTNLPRFGDPVPSSISLSSILGIRLQTLWHRFLWKASMVPRLGCRTSRPYRW